MRLLLASIPCCRWLLPNGILIAYFSQWLLKRSSVRVGATISEHLPTNIKTPKDLVFSSLTPKTHNTLKVLEIDQLRAEQNQQEEFNIDVSLKEIAAPHSPLPGTSMTEKFLKNEPKLEHDTMYQELDCEFFQDLDLWCSLDKEDQTQTIDAKNNNEDRAYNTPHTLLSPQGWEGLNANSPVAPASFYINTPKASPSSNMDNNTFAFPDATYYNNNNEEFMDISTLPVVIEDLAPDNLLDTSQLSSAMEQQSWTNTHDREYTQTYTTTQMPFIDQEDSLGYDMKCISWSDDVLTNRVDNNNIIVSEYVIKDTELAVDVKPSSKVGENNLLLNIPSPALPYIEDVVISTPDVLSCVEQLEKEKLVPLRQIDKIPLQDYVTESMTSIEEETKVKSSESSVVYEHAPYTPEMESYTDFDSVDSKPATPLKRRRHNSEDSDESYTPLSEKSTTRKYKRKKPALPIKDMIEMLEGSQLQHKARRGRPPKRRESTVSSVCSIDDSSSSIYNQDFKYRELRDKNNEASKRSRMNRKLKDLQMEQLAIDLEERNKKLKVRASILEDMTKRLKDALMTAILNK